MSGWWSENILSKEFDFFQRVMPPPIPLATDDYLFKTNTMFGFLGVLGFFMFIVTVCIFLARETKAFADLHFGEPMMISSPDAKGKAWFWVSQVVVIAIGVFVVWLLNKWKMNIYIDNIFRSAQPIYQGLWAMTMGVVVLLVSSLWYQLYGKKHNYDLREQACIRDGQRSAKAFWPLIVVVVAWVGLVFGAQYFFKTDYHTLLWFLLPFDADRIPGMLVVFPMYAIFYVALSISMNCFNFNEAAGKNKWVNSIVFSIITALPPVIVIAYTYGSFMATRNESHVWRVGCVRNCHDLGSRSYFHSRTY